MGLQSIKIVRTAPSLWGCSEAMMMNFFFEIWSCMLKARCMSQGGESTMGLPGFRKKGAVTPFREPFFLLWGHPRLPQTTRPIPEWPILARFSLPGHHNNFAHPIQGGIANPGNAWWGLEVLGSEVLFAHCLETASFIFLALFFF